MTIAELMKWVISHQAEIVAFFIAVLTMFNSISTKVASNQLKKLSESVYDKEQNIKIETLENEVKSLGSQILELKKLVEEMYKYTSTLQKRDKLRQSIKNSGNQLIQSNTQIPSHLRSLLIEGMDRSVDFFLEILKGGIENATKEVIFDKGMSDFRFLKLAATNSGISKSFEMKVKNFAIPALNNLIAKVTLLAKQTKSAQEKEDELIIVATVFVESFIQKSIEINQQTESERYA